MYSLFFVPLILFGISAAEECPAFPEFGDFGDKCIFLPLKNMRKDVYETCGIQYDASVIENLPSPSIIPEDFQVPSKCGRCAFKARCRQRDKKDGCFPWDLETKACAVGDSDDCENCDKACELPKLDKIGCEWGMIRHGLMQCVDTKEGIPDWKRDGWRNMVSHVPEARCVEKDGKCHCCCHPFHPDENGNCVEETQPACPDFSPWNDWSQCLWYPFNEMAKGVKEHCEIAYEPPEHIGNMLKNKPEGLPEDFEMPEKCGFCSMKVRCRKREKKEGCFFLDIDKKPCGNEDCETCGKPCPMPKIEGGCDWHKHLSGKLLEKIKGMIHKAKAEGKKMDYWKKAGMMKLIGSVPHGRCVEHDDQCHCCCMPFDPVVTDHGVECQPRPACATAAVEI